jgi:hypothetical protein
MKIKFPFQSGIERGQDQPDHQQGSQVRNAYHCQRFTEELADQHPALRTQKLSDGNISDPGPVMRDIQVQVIETGNEKDKNPRGKKNEQGSLVPCAPGIRVEVYII